MDTALLDVFEQARKLVADADRRMQEELEHKRELEREAVLQGLSKQIEDSFDFSSREKIELDSRLDVHEGKPVVEFAVRSLRAMFVLAPKNDEESVWTLSVLDERRNTLTLGDFSGGTKSETNSRRLAAARIVTAIGNWAQKSAQPVSQPAKPDPIPAMATAPAILQHQETERARPRVTLTFGSNLGRS